VGIHEGNEVAGNKFSDEILTLRDRLFFGHCRPSGVSLFKFALLGIAAGQGQSAPNGSFSIWRTRTNDPELPVTDT
jgi:hypothetical protein